MTAKFEKVEQAVALTFFAIHKKILKGLDQALTASKRICERKPGFRKAAAKY